MLQLLLVEDNPKLRPALAQGLESTNEIKICGQSASGENALQIALENGRPDCVLMDVQLEGKWNGIEAAVALAPRVSAFAARVLLDSGRRLLLPRFPAFGHFVALRLRPQIEFPVAFDDRAAP